MCVCVYLGVPLNERMYSVSMILSFLFCYFIPEKSLLFFVLFFDFYFDFT